MNQPCRPAKLIFLDSEIEVAASSLQDQWTLRMAAGLKSIVRRTGQLGTPPLGGLVVGSG